MKRKQKTQPQPPKQQQAFEGPMTNFQSNPTDPQGSYTGCPVDRYEVPVQDADDLSYSASKRVPAKSEHLLCGNSSVALAGCFCHAAAPYCLTACRRNWPPALTKRRILC